MLQSCLLNVVKTATLTNTVDKVSGTYLLPSHITNLAIISTTNMTSFKNTAHRNC